MAEVELIIKIPEEIRLALINNTQLSLDQQSICNSYMKQAIINGTPLPKGHGDLIDRNEAEKIADKMFEHITSPLLNHIQTYDAYNIIRLTPTIIKADIEREE